VRVKCPFYSRWVGMLCRCYSDEYHETRPSYIGCTSCPEWLYFSKFKSWMAKQDWKGKHLDKDLLIQGNKIYSPKTCLFVSAEVNTLLVSSKKNRGAYPIGVGFDKKRNKYCAKYRNGKKVVNLGYYKTIELAFSVYKKFKYERIKCVANMQSEPLRSALLNFKINFDDEMIND